MKFEDVFLSVLIVHANAISPDLTAPCLLVRKAQIIQTDDFIVQITNPFHFILCFS